MDYYVTSVNSCKRQNLIMGSYKLPVIVFDVTFNAEIIPANMNSSDRVNFAPNGADAYISLIDPSWIVIGGYCEDGENTQGDIYVQALTSGEFLLNQTFQSYGTTYYSGVGLQYTGTPYSGHGGDPYTGYGSPEKAPMYFITSNGKLLLPSSATIQLIGGDTIIGQIDGFRMFNCSYTSSRWNFTDYYNWGSNGWPVIDDAAQFFEDIPTDPYADGGYSGGGGGDGTFDLQNDTIDFPSLPTLSAVDTGLVSIYTPSLTQLKSLATFLWNANPTDVDWWKKLVANPLDLILGLSIVPVQVPAGAAQTIKVGLIDTGVSVTKAASQFVTVDCGSVTIKKNCGGSALDYSPFTKFSLYLPFIGTRTISCDDIMGRTVHVKYNVDLLSGGCTAMVKITGGPEDNTLNAILYQYSGACAISIPLTGETFTNMITSTIQLAASIGATVATGGAAAGVTAASAANSLMSMKPIIERAGGVSGAAGQLGIMKPYLIAEVPRQSVPADCNKFMGYPSNMKAVIGDLTGFTSVDIIHMENLSATNAEKNELESILKGGVIL